MLFACEAAQRTPPECVARGRVVVCPAPSLEGPDTSCAELVSGLALRVGPDDVDDVLAAASEISSPAGVVWVAGVDETGDSVFVRRDGVAIAPDPVGAFEVGQPDGAQGCLALGPGGFHDADCADQRDFACHDLFGLFRAAGCVAAGALVSVCEAAATFEEAEAFCLAEGAILAETHSRAVYTAITSGTDSPVWVGARAGGAGDEGFDWLSGAPRSVRRRLWSDIAPATPRSAEAPSALLRRRCGAAAGTPLASLWSPEATMQRQLTTVLSSKSALACMTQAREGDLSSDELALPSRRSPGADHAFRSPGGATPGADEFDSPREPMLERAFSSAPTRVTPAAAIISDDDIDASETQEGAHFLDSAWSEPRPTACIRPKMRPLPTHA